MLTQLATLTTREPTVLARVDRESDPHNASKNDVLNLLHTRLPSAIHEVTGMPLSNANRYQNDLEKIIRIAEFRHDHVDYKARIVARLDDIARKSSSGRYGLVDVVGVAAKQALMASSETRTGTSVGMTPGQSPTASALRSIMVEKNLPSAHKAAEIYATSERGLNLRPDQILSIEPAIGTIPASTLGWTPQRIIYSTHAPSEHQLKALQEKAHQIGQLELLCAKDAAAIAVTLTVTRNSLGSAQLAHYRAAMDFGIKRMGAEMAAERAAVTAKAAGAGTAINALGTVATDNPGKLYKATQEYNHLYRSAYGIKSVIVR